jgi:hypothetical protein
VALLQFEGPGSENLPRGELWVGEGLATRMTFAPRTPNPAWGTWNRKRVILMVVHIRTVAGQAINRKSPQNLLDRQDAGGWNERCSSARGRALSKEFRD